MTRIGGLLFDAAMVVLACVAVLVNRLARRLWDDLEEQS